MVGPRNIEEVVQVLKREVVRTRDSDMEKGGAYRTMLIQSIHTCAVRFPDIADRYATRHHITRHHSAVQCSAVVQ